MKKAPWFWEVEAYNATENTIWLHGPEGFLAAVAKKGPYVHSHSNQVHWEVFALEPDGYQSAHGSDGPMKTFRTGEEARAWAEEHFIPPLGRLALGVDTVPGWPEKP